MMHFKKQVSGAASVGYAFKKKVRKKINMIRKRKTLRNACSGKPPLEEDGLSVISTETSMLLGKKKRIRGLGTYL